MVQVNPSTRLLSRVDPPTSRTESDDTAQLEKAEKLEKANFNSYEAEELYKALLSRQEAKERVTVSSPKHVKDIFTRSHNGLARMFVKLGQLSVKHSPSSSAKAVFEIAIEHLDKAIEVDSRFSEALFNRGVAKLYLAHCGENYRDISSSGLIDASVDLALCYEAARHQGKLAIADDAERLAKQILGKAVTLESLDGVNKLMRWHPMIAEVEKQLIQWLQTVPAEKK